MVIRASEGEIAGAATTAGAMMGGGAGKGVAAAGAPVSGPAPAAGAPVATAAGGMAGCTAVGSGPTVPGGQTEHNIDAFAAFR